MALGKLFDNVAKLMKIEFEEQARLLGHPGEVGTGRENVLKTILTKYLPKRYSVDSGFVIDALGNKSEQMDIIIFEVNNTPVFEVVEGKKFFPCETVVAGGQVKTSVGSGEEMQKSLENIKSVKMLDRSNRGTNKIISGPGISIAGLKFNPSNDYRDQIFGFIFCSSSMKKESILHEFKTFNKLNERRFWTNLFVNYNEFFIGYIEKIGKEEFLSQNPMAATYITLTDKTQTPNLLGFFVGMLNLFLNEAHIARPNLLSYCNLEKRIRHQKISL
jgi:hypothetical protein